MGSGRAPWQAILAGMVAVTVVCMTLATRVVAGKRPSSRRRLRGLRRLAQIEVRLPRRSPAGTAEQRETGSVRNAITTVACAVILAGVVRRVRRGRPRPEPST